MVYDTDFREAACAAVDTAYPLIEQGANTLGPFVVPSNAGKLTAIRIYVSGLVTDVVTGTTTGIHISGGGVKIGEGWFAGPLVSESGAAATSGGFDFRDGMEYKTNIPVVGGGQINVTGYVWGEDMGTAHLLCELEFDGHPGRIVDADVREYDIGAAANTPVALIYRGIGENMGGFIPITDTIGEIVFGAALDPAGDAANGLVFAPALNLVGAGLLNSGNYNMLGPAGPTQPDTDVSGNQSVVCNPTRRLCGPNGIKTRKTARINAYAQNIESINASHAVVCLCYY